MVMDTDKDRSKSTFHSKGEISKEGKKWLGELGLVDIWREAHPTVTQYSFFLHTHRSYARLDYFLGTTEVNSVVKDIDIDPVALSNHEAVTVQLQVAKTQSKTGGWRLKEFMLHKKIVEQQLTRCITEYLEFNDSPEVTITTLWEVMKAVVRGNL